MKKQLLLIITSLSISFIISMNLQAGDSHCQEAAKKQEKECLKKFDANKNGVLDPDEKKAAKAAYAEHIKKYDKNGDGELDDSEKKAAKQDHHKDHKADKGDNGLDQ